VTSELSRAAAGSGSVKHDSGVWLLLPKLLLLKLFELEKLLFSLGGWSNIDLLLSVGLMCLRFCCNSSDDSGGGLVKIVAAAAGLVFTPRPRPNPLAGIAQLK